jgi:TolA-binding protein
MDEGGASRSFARAIDLIARGDYAAAGTELQTFRVAHPGDDRADLAAFLTIVSLQRAGRRGEAQEAARRYLELYPEGDRRADVVRVANER